MDTTCQKSVTSYCWSGEFYLLFVLSSDNAREWKVLLHTQGLSVVYNGGLLWTLFPMSNSYLLLKLRGGIFLFVIITEVKIRLSLKYLNRKAKHTLFSSSPNIVSSFYIDFSYYKRSDKVIMSEWPVFVHISKIGLRFRRICVLTKILELNV